ncbi:MAG: hypothetical protein FWC64_06500 [Treponema sp.]|nr:hypothetical protein [Treponema sp.]
MLEVTIPDKNSFYSLYSAGLLSRKTYVREIKSTVIEYARNSVIVLYYTYPTHRHACLVRDAPSPPANMAFLPGLSKKVSLIFSVHASRVDKLKRAIGFLHSNFNNAFSRDDGFYVRLHFILRQRGKLNYTALRELAGQTGEHYAHTL